MLEVQNGLLGGAYYGYDAQGKAVWYLFSGRLQSIEQPGGLGWSVDLSPALYAGGACLGCSYVAPSGFTTVGSLRIEFQQRNLARFRVGDGEWTTIWPLVYGASAEATFPGRTAYPFSSMRGAWVLVFKEFSPFHDPRDPQGSFYEGDGTRYARTAIGLSSSTDRGSAHLTFAISQIPEHILIGLLSCEPVDDSSDVSCYFDSDYDRDGRLLRPAKRYFMSLGAINDHGFKGEAGDGETVQGFRLDYD